MRPRSAWRRDTLTSMAVRLRELDARLAATRGTSLPARLTPWRWRGSLADW